ncbi:hypothetical protein [Serratia sp. Se-RSBMAAmG]|uniref:hypothetical protein n=1 Tax=Serratia sp. Se-RSBMAAmG TaxID=3043305 RepID=UPI0024AEF9EF|nr:hypothetical protein [Serratia sp. Se-RSBMAAmG]MDI6976539.1 hypothetical protein [Serratia sp. Se-RSBMAAmG]
MTYTHEQMKAKFGTVFVINALKDFAVEEHYRTGYFPYEAFLTAEEAAEDFRGKALVRYREETESAEREVAAYESKPVILRLLSWGARRQDYVVAKGMIEEADRRLKKKLANVESGAVSYLDKEKTYEIEYPELKVGDKVYLVVLEKNLLEEGLYTGEIFDIKYSLVDYNKVKFTGAFSLGLGEEREELQLNTDSDGRLKDEYMHHEVFLDKAEARERYQAKMVERLAFFEKKAKGE